MISTALTIIVKLTDVKLIKFLNRIPYKDQLLTKQDVTANKEIHEECPTSKTWWLLVVVRCISLVYTLYCHSNVVIVRCISLVYILYCHSYVVIVQCISLVYTLYCHSYVSYWCNVLVFANYNIYLILSFLILKNRT